MFTTFEHKVYYREYNIGNSSRSSSFSQEYFALSLFSAINRTKARDRERLSIGQSSGRGREGGSGAKCLLTLLWFHLSTVEIAQRMGEGGNTVGIE